MKDGIHYANRRVASVLAVDRAVAQVIFGAPWEEWRLIAGHWYREGAEVERVPVSDLVAQGFREVSQERWRGWMYRVSQYAKREIGWSELGLAWEELVAG